MQSLLKTRRSVGKSTLSERSGLHLGNWVQLDALRIIRTLEGIQMTFDVSGIAARTMLTTISCSMWRATKLHKKETAAARQKHHSDAPRVLVTICNHPALQELASLHQSVYADHRRLSLPSVQDGMRMIPAARHLEHSDMMRRYRSEHDAIVSRFLSDYASEAAAAPARLNGLYDASMWPTQAAIAEKFGLNVRYLSCPTDGASGLPKLWSACATAAPVTASYTHPYSSSCATWSPWSLILTLSASRNCKRLPMRRHR